MATSETTNLQLVKYGAGTDNFIRTDYNGNLDKIDTFAGTTNEAIAKMAINDTGSSASESEKNLNNITATGFYKISDATNYPSGSTNNANGTLIVMNYASTNYFTQIWIPVTNTAMFYRRRQASTWSGWQELALKSDVAELMKNSSSGGVDLGAYTSSSNKYTFPNDGYLMFNSGSVSSGKISVNIYTSNDKALFYYMNIATTYQVDMIFMKKGMKCYTDSKPAGASVSFMPLDA